MGIEMTESTICKSKSGSGSVSKRASPVLSAVEGLVCLDITGIFVLSRPNSVRNAD